MRLFVRMCVVLVCDSVCMILLSLEVDRMIAVIAQ